MSRGYRGFMASKGMNVPGTAPSLTWSCFTAGPLQFAASLSTVLKLSDGAQKKYDLRNGNRRRKSWIVALCMWSVETSALCDKPEQSYSSWSALTLELRMCHPIVYA